MIANHMPNHESMIERQTLALDSVEHRTNSDLWYDVYVLKNPVHLVDSTASPRI